MSDDEELLRLREAALKSKRKTGTQDKTEDFNQEAEESKLQVPDNANTHLQVPSGPQVYPQFYGPPPSLQSTQPPLLLPLPQPLAIPQPLPPQPLNSLHFPGFPQPYMTHPPTAVMNRVASIRSRFNPLNSNKDFNRTASPGYKSSNLIVITGNESENNSGRLNLSEKTSASTTSAEKRLVRVERSGTDQTKDRRSSEKEHTNLAREDRVRISKFERYKSNESSEDEECYISPSDDSASQKSNPESSIHSDFEDSDVKGGDAYDEGLKVRTTPPHGSKRNENFSVQHKQNAKNGSSLEGRTSTAGNELRKQASSKSSQSSSKSPDRKRMLSFSDDVEDFHLDIPDVAVVQASKTNNCVTRGGGKDAETSRNSPDQQRQKRSLQPPMTSSEKEQSISPRNRDKPVDQSHPKKQHRSSKSRGSPNRSKNTKSVVNKIDHSIAAIRRADRDHKDHKRPPTNFKRKYPTVREEHYERSPESLRERTYRKARYVDEREPQEYASDYREYSRGYSHHQRCYDKAEVYREPEEYYLYPVERRGHDDYPDGRVHDSYHRDYFEPHRIEDEERYRFSPPPKRYRERDHYRDSSERETLRIDLARRYEEEQYVGRTNVGKRHLTTNTSNIPSLLEGIFMKDELEKRYAVEISRSKFRSNNSKAARSDGRDHSKQAEISSRLKESHENKPKKIAENIRSKVDKKAATSKEASDRKPPRRVIESRNGASEKDRSCFNEPELRSRFHEQYDAKAPPTEKKLSQEGNSSSKSFERHSIHHRLGSKPERKNAIPCKTGSPGLVSA